MPAISTESSALEAGRGLRDEILSHGLRRGAVIQVRKILENHSKRATEFLTGLMGLSEAGTRGDR